MTLSFQKRLAHGLSNQWQATQAGLLLYPYLEAKSCLQILTSGHCTPPLQCSNSKAQYQQIIPFSRMPFSRARAHGGAAGRPLPANRGDLDNQIVTYLNIKPDSGYAPLAWQL
ncbi:hypothetical protein BGZ63DRAFT_406784 [Mariannaea sp. PMI_226]|nr:hypothetical protein BGZ63DRAFT_406784 [Mariannaea sp. PMI_226]